MDGYTLIDPPVSPFSEPSAIEAWLAQLRQMDPNPQVAAAIEQAQHWLDAARTQAPDAPDH